jgi:hypothetical protein
VDVAAFLLNEKRGEILKIETRHRVTIIMIPNKHLETPHYKMERIKHDDPRLDDAQASYAMAETAETDIGYSKRQKEDVKPRQEAVVKGITPDQPAPIVERKAPEPLPTLAPEAGLLGKIWSFFRKKTVEPAPWFTRLVATCFAGFVAFARFTAFAWFTIAVTWFAWFARFLRFAWRTRRACRLAFGGFRLAGFVTGLTWRVVTFTVAAIAAVAVARATTIAKQAAKMAANHAAVAVAVVATATVVNANQVKTVPTVKMAKAWNRLTTPRQKQSPPMPWNRRSRQPRQSLPLRPQPSRLPA